MEDFILKTAKRFRTMGAIFLMYVICAVLILAFEVSGFLYICLIFAPLVSYRMIDFVIFAIEETDKSIEEYLANHEEGIKHTNRS